MRSTPIGFRQPAEWLPHVACWLAWPSDGALWQDHLEPARREFVALCRAIADPDSETGACRGERLEILVPDQTNETLARVALAGLDAHFHRLSFGDIWLRDTAPIFVTDGAGARAATGFAFNGWGGRYVLAGDETVARAIARQAGLPLRTFPFVFEGGSLEVDGTGTGLTTRQCLLNPNRNPAMTQAEIEAGLAESLGITKLLWLDDGLLNDHTDGHIDTVARFIAPATVLCMEARSDDDPNRAVLAAIARDLSTMSDAEGRPLLVVVIPSPGRVLDDEGEVMPASYVNFYIGNRTVVVPTYGTPFDREAVAAIAHCFPERRTVGLPARAILGGGGAFHCITQQQP